MTQTPEKFTVVSKEEVEVMIADAIFRHNRNASIISSMLVGLFLHFFEGELRLIGVIPPVFPWLNIHL